MDEAPRPQLSREAELLVRERLTFALPFAIAGLVGFLAITALAGFTNLLDQRAYGPISWLCVLLLLLLPLCGAAAILYGRRAQLWDARAVQTLRAASRNRPV